MEEHNTHQPDPSRSSSRVSPVKAVISWLVETDREFRVAQTMVDEARFRR